jgi:hypothetical protein
MTNTATEATTISSTATLVREIQVSGGKCFEGWNWREAIYYFLNGMDAGKRDVTDRPKICFTVECPESYEGLALKLNPEDESYFIYQESIDDGDAFAPGHATQSIHASLRDYRHVEHALRRFARNNAVDVLFLEDEHPVTPKRICLWKIPGKRQELHILLERMQVRRR